MTYADGDRRLANACGTHDRDKMAPRQFVYDLPHSFVAADHPIKARRQR